MDRAAVRLFKAIRANRIDVPIMHYELLDNEGIRLYLYGGEILEWKAPDEERPVEDAKEIEPGGQVAAKKVARKRTPARGKKK